MKRILTSALATSLLAGSIALANPVRLAFDDSGFDYAAREDASSAYLQLVRDGDDLRLTFSDSAGGTTLPAVNVEAVPDLNREDLFGDDLLATVDDLAEIRVIRHGLTVHGFDLTHEDVAFRDAVAMYVQAIEKAGFTTSIERSNSNLRVFNFEDGDARLRAVFRRADGQVRVHLEAL